MKKYLFILIVASIATHFLFFGHPSETVFDEVHFGKFISGYFTHEYFFDIHPPLGKLMISGMGWLTNFEPGFSFAEIGQRFPDRHYLWLRLLPAIAGTLLPIAIFFLIRRLKISNLAAFTGAMLIVFENALLVQSRFILLDSFLLLFGFLSLLFYLKYKEALESITHNLKPITWLCLSGFFAALAVSIKWTGATFLALIVILEFTRILKQILKTRHSENAWRPNFQKLVLALVILPFMVYFSIFVLHFSLLNKSGPGDAFMTPEFRKTLAGSTENQNRYLVIEPLSAWGKFVELNIQMYKSNTNLTATHPYSSQWYSWPFMIRPVYYWNKTDATSNPDFVSRQSRDYKIEDPRFFSSDKIGAKNRDNQSLTAKEKLQSRIYLLGNPVVWWAATLAMIYILVQVGVAVMGKIRKMPVGLDQNYGHFAFIYIFNLLPFIGIKRAMFLYHYFPALVFSIIALVYLIDKLTNKKRIFTILLATSVAVFIFLAPLTYGLPLTEEMYRARVWLKTWL